MKKLSLLLVLCIIISSYAPFTAFADTDYTCEFIGGMAVLNDNIELNLYMKLSNNLLIDSNYVNISYTNVNEKVDFNTLTDKYNSEIGGYNVYTVKLPPKKIDETITITPYINNTPQQSTEYSLRKYLQDLQTTSQDNNSLKKLAQATEDYCTFASVYFNKISVPADVQERVNNSNISCIGNERTKITTTSYNELQNDNNIEYVGMSLSLESSIKVRLYFELKNNAEITDYSFKLNRDDIQPNPRGTKTEYTEKYYYIEQSINIKQLGDTFTFGINKRPDYFNVNFSAFAYAYQIINKSKNNNDDYNPEFIALLKSLILYYRAAKDYTTN